MASPAPKTRTIVRRNGASEKRVLFLTALGAYGTVQHAAKAAGLGRRTVYNWRNEDLAFAQEWDDRIEDCTDVLEQSLYQRAMEGDTTAAIFLLKGARPAKYRDNHRVEHTGEGGAPIEVVVARDKLRERVEQVILADFTVSEDDEP